MPSPSRIIFVSIPFLLTLGTIVGLTLTYTGNISKSSIAQAFWFFGLDTSKAHLATSSGANTVTLDNLPGWYVVGLWNYCTGPAHSKIPTFCSKPSYGYFFNPIKVLNLPSDVIDLIPTKYTNDLQTLSALSKWASTAYLIAIILAAITIPVSILAFKRRLGSLLAAILSAATCLFAVGASAAATTMYAILLAVVNEGFGSKASGQNYNIKAEIHKSALAATWIGSLCAIVAFFFWLFTACCCRGRVAGEGKARQMNAGPTRTMTGEKYQRISAQEGMGYNAGHNAVAGYNAGAGYAQGYDHGLPAQRYEPYAHRS